MKSFSTIVFFLLLGASPVVYAQEPAAFPPTPARVERVLTTASLNFLGAAIGQERRLGSSVTLSYGAGVHYSFYSTTLPIGGTRFINVVDPYFGRDYGTRGVVPYVAGELRVYHTLFRRTKAGKNVRHNAANYFAAFAEMPFRPGNLINVPNLALASPIGLKYGMRRSLGTHLYGEASIGVASKNSRNQRTVLPRLDASIAWRF